MVLADCARLLPLVALEIRGDVNAKNNKMAIGAPLARLLEGCCESQTLMELDISENGGGLDVAVGLTQLLSVSRTLQVFFFFVVVVVAVVAAGCCARALSLGFVCRAGIRLCVFDSFTKCRGPPAAVAVGSHTQQRDLPMPLPTLPTTRSHRRWQSTTTTWTTRALPPFSTR